MGTVVETTRQIVDRVYRKVSKGECDRNRTADVRIDHIRQDRRGLREAERLLADLPTRRQGLVREGVSSGWPETQEDPSHEIARVWSGGIHGC